MNVDSCTSNTSDLPPITHLSPVGHLSHISPSVRPLAENLSVGDHTPASTLTCEATAPLPVSTRRCLFNPIREDATHDADNDANTAFSEFCMCAISIVIPINKSVIFI